MLARDVRPEIGARTDVYSRLSRATRSAASAPSTSACEVREPEVHWSTSCCDTACESSSFWARASSLCASSSFALFDASVDCARATSASNGRGSIVNIGRPS